VGAARPCRPAPTVGARSTREPPLPPPPRPQACEDQAHQEVKACCTKHAEVHRKLLQAGQRVPKSAVAAPGEQLAAWETSPCDGGVYDAETGLTHDQVRARRPRPGGCAGRPARAGMLGLGCGLGDAAAHPPSERCAARGPRPRPATARRPSNTLHKPHMHAQPWGTHPQGIPAPNPHHAAAETAKPANPR
jgi:hypothetical protein